jgi:hypothetical protein
MIHQRDLDHGTPQPAQTIYILLRQHILSKQNIQKQHEVTNISAKQG